MDLEQKIATYRPPKTAKALIRDATIALLVGISGAGKDTIKKALLRDPHFHDIVSHTTRAPRHNEGVLERDGVDYHFVSGDVVSDMIDRGEFVEVKHVHDTVYGTSVASVKSASDRGVAVTDIDVQGVAEYKAVSPGVIAIFIVPPSYDAWIERLKRRYSSPEEFTREWPKRRASAIAELTRALELPYYHCVINDDLDRAVLAIKDITSQPDTFTRKDDEARLVARDLLQSIRS